MHWCGFQDQSLVIALSHKRPAILVRFDLVDVTAFIARHLIYVVDIHQQVSARKQIIMKPGLGMWYDEQLPFNVYVVMRDLL